MTAVIAQDDGWLDNGLFEIRTDEECHCSEYVLQSSATCSGDEYRWLPGTPDSIPLRFGGAA